MMQEGWEGSDFITLMLALSPTLMAVRLNIFGVNP
jgi:hypothetical protein